MSQVPHSTQSSYVNCMRPFWNSKHFAGQEFTHMVCGHVSHTSGSTVMCAYSCASVTYLVAPRRALMFVIGRVASADCGSGTVRGFVSVVGPAGPGSAFLA